MVYLAHTSSASVFFRYFDIFKMQYVETCNIKAVSTYDSSSTKMLPLLRVTWFIKWLISGSIPLSLAYLNYYYLYNLKCWMVVSPQNWTSYIIFSGRGVLPIIQYLDPPFFDIFGKKVLHGGIYVTPLSPIQIQP